MKTIVIIAAVVAAALLVGLIFAVVAILSGLLRCAEAQEEVADDRF